MAAKKGNIETLEYLVADLQKKGIGINVKDDSGVSISCIQKTVCQFLLLDCYKVLDPITADVFKMELQLWTGMYTQMIVST